MPDEKPLFISDIRAPTRSSWTSEGDWAMGSSSKVDIVDGEFVPQDKQASVIPDNGIAQYDAQSLSFSDGDSVTTWGDELGNYGLSGGSPTFRGSVINGHPAVVFDGAGDLLTNTNISVTPPFTVFVVFIDNHANSATGGYENTLYGSNNLPTTYLDRGSNWEMQGGTGGAINIGSSPSGPHVITNNWDGSSNSEFRVDGVVEASGDANTQTFDALGLGNNINGSQGYGNISIGEFVLCDGEVTGTERANEEQRLASKWGVSI